MCTNKKHYFWFDLCPSFLNYVQHILYLRLCCVGPLLAPMPFVHSSNGCQGVKQSAFTTTLCSLNLQGQQGTVGEHKYHSEHRLLAVRA